jgi:hypothetical protein
VLIVIKRECVTEVPLNPIIRARTHYFRHVYPPTRHNTIYGEFPCCLVDGRLDSVGAVVCYFEKQKEAYEITMLSVSLLLPNSFTFYAVRVIAKRSRRLVLPRTFCKNLLNNLYTFKFRLANVEAIILIVQPVGLYRTILSTMQVS